MTKKLSFCHNVAQVARKLAPSKETTSLINLLGVFVIYDCTTKKLQDDEEEHHSEFRRAGVEALQN